jgi:hypothetical protein
MQYALSFADIPQEEKLAIQIHGLQHHFEREKKNYPTVHMNECPNQPRLYSI